MRLLLHRLADNKCPKSPVTSLEAQVGVVEVGAGNLSFKLVPKTVNQPLFFLSFWQRYIILRAGRMNRTLGDKRDTVIKGLILHVLP